ncbi:ABC transporter ATP-binding protein [Serratia marcescens]|uniref:ABC transporter ATP-binding protein n=2 Tax=Serratia marcescens TaxID=615 RepID=UPI000F7DA1F7|nr:oligopeptide/dipeptide ABC transporter ATP-binding protein [Serratia marcescens]RTG63862.1 ATP-binding cassette domain-containing protein [Serratia marcescens]
MSQPLVAFDRLSVSFQGEQGPVRAVQQVSLELQAGQTLGIVGESGCGKSVTAMALMGLLPQPLAQVDGGEIRFEGQNLLSLRAAQMADLRGNRLAMIFQEPMSALNPVLTLGEQLLEPLIRHLALSPKAAWRQAVQLLEEVGLARAEALMRCYPHQLSGGMSQRVMIAMAIACRPKLLIADEPTTALDVTIQAQIIELLLDLQQRENMALLLITHDLALVAEAAHHIIVMYAGQVVESGKAAEIFRAPRHPYTQALLRALPEFAADKARLASLPGVVPGKYDRPTGCLLNPRCPYANERCRNEEPELRSIPGRQVKCHTPLDDAGRPTV